MNRWAELVGAATLLTRLPVGNLAASHPAPACCTWAYPVVGLAIGAAGGTALWAGMALGLPQAIAVVWTLAATALLTGGLHEDGLADTADGFGGGRTRERKLAIMRDSRIGSFGALALMFSVALRGAALTLSPHPVRGLVLASILGRGAMLLPLLLLHPARSDGLAASLALRNTASVLTGLAIAALVGVWAPVAVGATLAATLALGLIARSNIGGYTGDVLGATEQVAECAALSCLA